jgi:hypothetical protein
MEKGLKLFIFLFQLFISFAVMVGVYLFFAILDTEPGFAEVVGFTLFQPILAIIFSTITIVFCFLIGLPIRLNSKINSWWTRHPVISLSGAVTGIIFILLSLYPTLRESETEMRDGQEIIKEIPNLFLSITGWFLIAFCLLHLYPSTNLRLKASRLLSQLCRRLGRKN